MTPTRGNEEINRRIKSAATAVYQRVPLRRCSTTSGRESVQLNIERRDSLYADRHSEDMTEKGSKRVQFLAAAAANISALAVGAMGSWTSPMLPLLQDTGGPLGSPISQEESSWIGSLMALGAIIGIFAAGYLSDRYGRKRTLLSFLVPYLIAWILTATAGHVAQLYVARFIFGIALGFPFTVVPMYCGEIAEVSVRGALGSFLQLFVTIGCLYAYSTGPFVGYTGFWIILGIPPVIFFACFVMMPESPYYLLSNGRKDEAIASLAKLRSKSEAAVQKEADEIQAELDVASKEQVSISELFKVKANLKALFYTCALVSFQQLTGISVVLLYMQTIFQAAESAIPDAQAAIIIAVVQVLGSAVTPVIVDRSGRRMLLLFSGIGVTLSVCVLGFYFYLKEVQKATDVDQISWLPVVTLVIFIATYSMGWGPVPWAMMGEMFASNIKAKASVISTSVCWGLAFFIAKFSTNLTEAFGNYATFWMFGGFCILNIVFTIFLLPETKNKTLQQIQDELNGVTLSSRDAENSRSTNGVY